MEEDGFIEPLSENASEQGDLTSDYDSSINESLLYSVTTTVNEHVYEYGRRYQSYRQGRYPLPNDEVEHDREALKHIMLKELIGGKLHMAPIGENPQKIIDLGTGFGDWAIEAAETYPSAEVVGIDLSPIQPSWVPPNLRFVVDDIEDEASWIHGENIDFFHLRFMCHFLRDIRKLLEGVIRSLKPGGFIEFQDPCYKVCCDDGTVPPDYPVSKFLDLIKRVFSDSYGFDITQVEEMPEILKSVGFVNISRRVLNVPIGGWPKDPNLSTIGRYWRPSLLDLFAAVASKPLIEAEIDRAEADRMLQECHVAMENRRIHAYMLIHFVWAQKPEA